MFYSVKTCLLYYSSQVLLSHVWRLECTVHMQEHHVGKLSKCSSQQYHNKGESLVDMWMSWIFQGDGGQMLSSNKNVLTKVKYGYAVTL